MGKEIVKLGNIVCTIEADKSYRSSRNEDQDFTLATEKPKMNAEVSISDLKNGWKSYKLTDSNVVIKANEIGAEIINLCNGRRAIETIAFEVANKFDLEESDEDFLEKVKTFLNIFKTYRLV